MKHILFIYKYKYQIAFAIGVLFLLSGCKDKEQSPELKAMLESSAFTTPLTTGSEISRRYQDRQTKPLLGKPKQPEVIIEYEPKGNHTKEDIYNEIVKILEETNWERETLSVPQAGYYRASLPQADFTIVAEVVIYSERNIVGVHLTTVPR